ncbi:MAG TPA: PEP-CTERM sorting domain-containing protein [Bryobacteraceae bacterium]|nr:PEP-CTERM sorting domain-containing protein [Bryobacteraceae bacterium]
MRNVSVVLRLGLVASIALLAGLPSATASTIAVGYISWNLNFPGNAGEFDIINNTGPINGTNPDFPIQEVEPLSDLSLMVTFSDGSTETFGSSYFTLSPDGESYDGSAIPIGGTNPTPVSATLTGDFGLLTVDLFGGGTVNIDPTFTVSLSDSPNLLDGDLGIIYANTSTGGGVPEPTTWLLAGTGILGLLVLRRKRVKVQKSAVLKGLLPVLCLVVAQSAFGSVRLNSWTAPSSGAAGINNVNITGSGFPTSGTITPANIVVTIYSGGCDSTLVTTAAGNSIRTVLGSTKRVNFSIPATLTTGRYFVTVADSAAGDANFSTTTGSCSEVAVTGSTKALNACVAGSSLGVLLPSGGASGNVTAYVPKGYWSGTTTGVFVQNIEGTIGSPSTVSTTNVVNSCSSNPATQQTVCVANNTDVYLITGTSLSNTLTSGSNTFAGFSGGSCQNCGVAVNALANTAVINMGLSGGSSGDGIQILNLSGTPTFNTPFPMQDAVSENISVDPTRSLILSANEAENYVLLQIQSGGSLMEYDSTFITGAESDSSAEDCSTGVAIAPGEFTNNVFLTDLTQAVLTPGTPGTYTAPNQNFTLVTDYSFSAGLSGAAVAQGSAHLGIVTGEFGGNTAAVIQLPSTSGSGTPTVVDYASFEIPSSTACGGTFSAGFDPHTVTAYTSPNNGKPYAVFVGYSFDAPICLAVVDMQAVMAAPRGGSGLQPHDVAPTDLPVSAVAFFAL